MVQGELAEEDQIRELEAHGQTVYLAGTGTDGPVFGALFPGGSALFFRAQFEAGTGENQREEVALGLIEGLNISRYAALESSLGQSRGSTDGFRHYEARFPRFTMGIDYPDGWQPVDLYEFSGLARMVGFSRNPMEGVRLLQDQSSFSLPASDSGYVTVTFLGTGISPEEYAEEALAGGSGLTIGETVAAPEKRPDLSIAGSDGAMEIVTLGEDGAGRDVDYRLLLAELEQGLIAVSVMSPHSGAPISPETVEAMVSSLSLAPR